MKSSSPEEALPPHLERLFILYKRMYERMERENSWPWVVDPEGWEKLMSATQTNQNESQSDEAQEPLDHRDHK
jgi:hypothetical protein